MADRFHVTAPALVPVLVVLGDPCDDGDSLCPCDADPDGDDA